MKMISLSPLVGSPIYRARLVCLAFLLLYCSPLYSLAQRPPFLFFLGAFNPPAI
jgi:hypothetical protein